MAHTPRAANEKRHQPLMYKLGARIGMYIKGVDGEIRLMKGRVTHHDEGGWIYAKWDGNGPGWLRATHCFLLEDEVQNAA